MIGLISCSSTKKDRPSIARDLYTSPLFQKSLAYAERRCMRTYILSAAHGLVGVDDFLTPYNRRLGPKKERALWGHRTASTIRANVLPHEELLILAGEDYAAPLRASLGDRHVIHEPLKGMQVGERLAWLNADLAKMPLQLPAPRPASRASALWLTPRPERVSDWACSFCGKSEKQAKRMISGPAVCICDECVGLCVEIIDEHAEAAA